MIFWFFSWITGSKQAAEGPENCNLEPPTEHRVVLRISVAVNLGRNFSSEKHAKKSQFVLGCSEIPTLKRQNPRSFLCFCFFSG